ncbi:lipoprotein NlpI [Pasteurella testudinis DSM 23072]|uniref:Lipoprotein NlpI n=1 Tax=Pasteurella testudinis DSM 23072 TaxID=1122938 RepID=A0A1W1UBS4_9PAST|nr:lipoprotein NlpI [Pasteurella testudinis]SMB78251.1 lipoprotein NlpI [Pasteurella testudinis DSM 23072]SUB52636.1 lipoprotein NlpI [Pasteurella testudinis]
MKIADKVVHYTKSFCVLAFLLAAAACSMRPTSPLISEQKVTLAEQNPLLHFDQEVMIARISQVLLVGNLGKDERASLHFERGVLYDSLGLWGLARYDFTQALMLQPKLAPIYNYLGLYLLLDGDYDGSLDAFNAVLHLDSNYEYAYLNRGLNFYYVGRYGLAERDFLTFYEADPSDPYRTLWLYLNELKYKPHEAKRNLAERAKGLSNEFWGTNIVHYYLGELSFADLQQKIDNFAVPYAPQYAEILTETYFYLAKQQLNLGKVDEATALFKLAIANQVFNFVEYRFALFELSRLRLNESQTLTVVPDTN